jgi:hypothetical protein
MKESLFTVLFLALFTLVSIPAVSEEKIDLTGTWESTIYIGGIDIEMELTLLLKEENGVISGKITDDWGYINCDAMEPKRENNTLIFKSMVETSGDKHQMIFKLAITKNEMKGQWESLGSYSDCVFIKKEEGENKTLKKFTIEDIVGVWKGPAAYKDNPGSKNILTLVLKEKEGNLFGTFSDQYGTPYDQVKIVSFQENNLMLEISLTFENEDYVMDIDAAVKDRSHMKGKFEIEKMGKTGIWTAEKQK